MIIAEISYAFLRTSGREFIERLLLDFSVEYFIEAGVLATFQSDRCTVL